MDELMTVATGIDAQLTTTNTQTNLSDSSDSVRDNFFGLHESLNTIPAQAPTYMEACAKLKLNPLEPRLPGLSMSKENPKQPNVYKNHQPPFLAWAIDMEAVLDASPLCDEIGLGKTISALSLMAEQAYRHGAARPTATAAVAPTLSADNVLISPTSFQITSSELCLLSTFYRSLSPKCAYMLWRRKLSSSISHLRKSILS